MTQILIEIGIYLFGIVAGYCFCRFGQFYQIDNDLARYALKEMEAIHYCAVQGQKSGNWLHYLRRIERKAAKFKPVRSL